MIKRISSCRFLILFLMISGSYAPSSWCETAVVNVQEPHLCLILTKYILPHSFMHPHSHRGAVHKHVHLNSKWQIIMTWWSHGAKAISSTSATCCKLFHKPLVDVAALTFRCLTVSCDRHSHHHPSCLTFMLCRKTRSDGTVTHRQDAPGWEELVSAQPDWF